MNRDIAEAVAQLRDEELISVDSGNDDNSNEKEDFTVNRDIEEAVMEQIQEEQGSTTAA